LGRRKKPSNAHLPPGVFQRGRRLYFGKNGEALGTDAKAIRTAFRVRGIGIDAKQFTMPPSYPKALWLRARTNARTKRVPFAITIEEVGALIEATGGRCALTGIRFNYNPVFASRFRPWVPSLDRVQPPLGYVVPNLRVLCAYANLAINEFGEILFLELARAYVRHSKRMSISDVASRISDAVPARRDGRVVEGA